MLQEHSDRFSVFPLDYGEFSVRTFEMYVPEAAQTGHSRPYRIGHILFQDSRRDPRLTPYPSLSVAMGLTSLACVHNKYGGVWITVNNQKLNSITQVLKISTSRWDEGLDTLGGGSVWFVSVLLMGTLQMNSRGINLTSFCAPTAVTSWLRIAQDAAGAPPSFIFVMRIVTDDRRMIRVYLDDPICLDITSSPPRFHARVICIESLTRST